ncbi:unnamed protein product [Arctia plantaginis]|uniref:Uncharacterized protein n=1 Tax=Arctia plantaginis TaxID=874455 RepID=A0A8S1B489_ARCPL|nr:unnamed protein product [Arctia plantaginis]
MSKSKSRGSQDVRDLNFNTAIKKLQITSDTTNNNAQAWKKWWQQLELYLLATSLENADMNDATLNEFKVRFDDFFEPRKNITMCRYIFFTRRQSKSESIEEFLTDLENKNQDCEFGTLRESLIRMRELTRTIIVAQQDAEKMVNESTSENVMHLRRRSRSRGDSRQRAPVVQQKSVERKSTSPGKRLEVCSRCGQSHRYKCPAKGVQCRSCNLFAILVLDRKFNMFHRFINSICTRKEIKKDKRINELTEIIQKRMAMEKANQPGQNSLYPNLDDPSPPGRRKLSVSADLNQAQPGLFGDMQVQLGNSSAFLYPTWSIQCTPDGSKITCNAAKITKNGFEGFS